ncbi:MAG: acetamidase/formamidase family protein [Cyanophyceae cyanobacterium]
MPKVKRQLVLFLAVLLVLGSGAIARSQLLSQSSPVVLERVGDFCRDDPKCFNRLHPAIEPAATAEPGQQIVFGARDAFDGVLTIESTAEDVAAADLSGVHPLTGPVAIAGAQRGDAIAVTIVDIEPDEYGYTAIVPGFGFLRDLFPDPYLANWNLTPTAATSEQIPQVTIPFAGFTGSIGVLPGEPELERFLEREAALEEVGGIVLTPLPTGALPEALCGPNGTESERCLRTVPPRENGGNMDIKQMQIGTTVILPCFVDGCGLYVGDVHFAQGDGEVSGTAIEIGANVTVTAEVRPGLGESMTMPQFEGGDQLKAIEPDAFHATTGIPIKPAGEIPPYLTYLDSEEIAPLENLSEDLTLAARNALIEMVDYIVAEYELTREQAYVVCSVAADLRIGQLVDVPNYIVSAILPLNIFNQTGQLETSAVVAKP